MVTYYKDHHIDVATVQKTKPGNTVCGDGHIVLQADTYTICAVIDGLGSGKGAHLSAEKAIRAIQDHQGEDAQQILEHCNEYLTNERGAVITLLRIDYEASTLTYSNFGNIGFILYQPDGTVVQPLPKRGYLCGRVQKLSSEQFSYKPGSRFVMYSDGIEQVPKLHQYKVPSCSVSDNLLHGDFYSNKDDATLMVGNLK
ncbi:PP2C family serine/threonine-protein phosphatase [Shouchella sp. 1P09AA]|uniref:PP2C family serine/threonine-protein phosphatase n=1 Tax=unclassified Shouchella TaxID=2893065 RepID=UPI0039A113F7